MNVNSMKYLSWTLLFLTGLGSTVQGNEDEKHRADKNEVSVYYRGGEVFDTAGSYEIILTQDENETKKAKDEVRALKQQGKAATYRSKSLEQKNEIYFRLAELLPAGTVFRIKRAHNYKDGNAKVTIETKEPLSSDDIPSNSDVLEFSASEIYGYVAPVRVEPDDATKSLPSGWDKERGYSAVVAQLANGAKTVKVSVVFSNPGNVRKNMTGKDYYGVINSLRENKIAGEYGIGFSDNEIAWWTQDIDLEQVTALYENTKVINLVPRTQNQ